MTRQPSANAFSVYLVEDSDLLGNRLQEALECDMGLLIAGRSGDAQTAIAAIRDLEPDLVIVDLSLRQGSGFDVLRAGCSMDDPKPIFLVLSNHSSAPYRHAAEQFGVDADHFFDKTEQMGSLTRYVQELADKRSTSVMTGGGSIGRDYEQGNRGRSVQGARRTRHT